MENFNLCKYNDLPSSEQNSKTWVSISLLCLSVPEKKLAES